MVAGLGVPILRVFTVLLLLFRQWHWPGGVYESLLS